MVNFTDEREELDGGDRNAAAMETARTRYFTGEGWLEWVKEEHRDYAELRT